MTLPTPGGQIRHTLPAARTTIEHRIADQASDSHKAYRTGLTRPSSTLLAMSTAQPIHPRPGSATSIADATGV